MEMDKKSEFGFYIKKINDALVAHANAQLKRLDVTYAQMEVIFFLLERQDGQTTQKDIEEHFNLKHSSVVGLLQRMRAKGLVDMEVNARDHRSRNVFLLGKAFDILNEMRRTRQAMEQHIANYLTEEQLEQLAELLSVFYSAIRNDEEHRAE